MRILICCLIMCITGCQSFMTKEPSPWYEYSKIDESNGSIDIRFSTICEGGHVLTIRNKNNTIDLFISYYYGNFKGKDDMERVKYRIGKEKPVESFWYTCVSHRTLFYHDPNNMIPIEVFIAKLTKESTFTIKNNTNYGTYEFDITGLKETLLKHKEYFEPVIQEMNKLQ